ncbi:MAG: DNA-binding protein HU [Candidatus Uhrbacteria bacterium GW2011_GWF2_44_350]|uniref:DNA-binding protein HU n=1 Tax=Candidatus Uhrbacteria bacterium GW2011_GWF2_44_350 TaxID=1619000 RepID=A0A0G1JEU8_9BACT|nr:MAG: DNA-binding protein HU [Candidatus Uhrbacteria bacterium GW2011_GWF2_44_350]HBR80104.1 DNA-binding protein [Candidatus Uhrbacteria bacterium]HCU32197.1 DNA-binding protein [Candidatus Uhrbacteria bacterium]
MNKAELAIKLSERLNIAKKLAEDFIENFEDIVTQTLVNDGEVTIAGFGTFSARVRAGRAGVNPQNPSEKIQIPSVKVPKFKSGKSLKDALKGKINNPAPITPVEPVNPPPAVSTM